MRITNVIPGDWKELQNKVAEILSDCLFSVSTEKTIETSRGHVEIDVYAKDTQTIPTSVYIIECKNWDRAVPQEKIHALYSVVQNTGANHGLLISKSGYQAGAYAASEYTNITLLKWHEFLDLYKIRWLKSRISKLSDLSHSLYQFTSILSGKYDKEYFALTLEEKNVYQDMMRLYSDVVTRSSRHLLLEFGTQEISFEALEYYMKTGSDFFSGDYKCYEDYLSALEEKCLLGINSFNKLLFKSNY